MNETEINLIALLCEIEKQVGLAQASIGGEENPFEVYLAPALTETSPPSFAVLIDDLPLGDARTYFVWGWLKAMGLPAFVVASPYYTRPQRVEMAIVTEQLRIQAKPNNHLGMITQG